VGVVIPGALEWSDIYGDIIASTGVQTLSLITVPISIAASATGSGILHYILNGSVHLYTGAFSVSSGDTLAWQINNFGPGGVSGTITITNSSHGGDVLDAPTYVVSYSGRQ